MSGEREVIVEGMNGCSNVGFMEFVVCWNGCVEPGHL